MSELHYSSGPGSDVAPDNEFTWIADLAAADECVAIHLLWTERANLVSVTSTPV